MGVIFMLKAKKQKSKGGKTVISENKCLFYEAEDIFEMLGLQKTAGYRYLEKVMKSGKPFKTIRIGKLYRISKVSFDAWIQNEMQ